MTKEETDMVMNAMNSGNLTEVTAAADLVETLILNPATSMGEKEVLVQVSEQLETLISELASVNAGEAAPVTDAEASVMEGKGDREDGAVKLSSSANSERYLQNQNSIDGETSMVDGTLNTGLLFDSLESVIAELDGSNGLVLDFTSSEKKTAMAVYATTKANKMAEDAKSCRFGKLSAMMAGPKVQQLRAIAGAPVSIVTETFVFTKDVSVETAVATAGQTSSYMTNREDHNLGRIEVVVGVKNMAGQTITDEMITELSSVIMGSVKWGREISELIHEGAAMRSAEFSKDGSLSRYLEPVQPGYTKMKRIESMIPRGIAWSAFEGLVTAVEFKDMHLLISIKGSDKPVAVAKPFASQVTKIMKTLASVGIKVPAVWLAPQGGWNLDLEDEALYFETLEKEAQRLRVNKVCAFTPSETKTREDGSVACYLKEVTPVASEFLKAALARTPLEIAIAKTKAKVSAVVVTQARQAEVIASAEVNFAGVKAAREAVEAKQAKAAAKKARSLQMPERREKELSALAKLEAKLAALLGN